MLIIFIAIGFAGAVSLFGSAVILETNASLQRGFAAAEDATSVAIRRILIGETAFEAPPSTLSHTVRLYYTARGFKPVWSDGGQILPSAEAFTKLLEDVSREGLDPDRPAYHRERIETLLSESTDGEPDRLATLDLLLTNAFFALGHDLHFGVAYGADLNATHEYGNTPVDMRQVLDHAAASGEIEASLLSLTPKHPEYRRLITALAFYRSLADEGGWSTNAADYAKDDAVRERLIASGDLNESNGTVTPEKLEAAVKRFQQRFGITADGVVGPVTSAKMAISPAELVDTIKLNVERWKWMPPHEDGLYIIVNIPGFELKVMRAGY